jgi:hypothetical protein
MMDDARRREVVEAARTFERDLEAGRGGLNDFVRLAQRFHGLADFVRVDDVVYLACSASTLLRIPLAEIPDLAAMSAEEARR